MTTSAIEDVLRIERARSGMTVEEMCSKVNIPLQTYYSMRNTNFKTMRASNLIALADLFGVSVDYLLGRKKTHEM